MAWVNRKPKGGGRLVRSAAVRCLQQVPIDASSVPTATTQKGPSEELSNPRPFLPPTGGNGSPGEPKRSPTLGASCRRPPSSLAGMVWVPRPSQFVRSVPASAQGPSSAAGAAGPPPATNVSSNKRLQQTQAQVDEVVDIMRMNVDKVLERDQKLSELDNRADALQAGASQFETSAAKLKRKYWWKNCKMMIILGVVCAVILIIIIIFPSKTQEEHPQVC
ncbi:vesicle-associated membrane protein 2-like [Sylvia atricapilla]